MTVLQRLRMAREEHEAELGELVSLAIRAGAPTHELARALGVSRATVWRRFREELRAPQTVGTSTAFTVHPIKDGVSPIDDGGKHPQRRMDHGAPPAERFIEADGAGPVAPVKSPVDARRIRRRAGAAQREAVRASRRASELTRTIAIVLGTVTRLRRQRARLDSAKADRGRPAGDEHAVRVSSMRSGSNVPASDQTAYL